MAEDERLGYWPRHDGELVRVVLEGPAWAVEPVGAEPTFSIGEPSVWPNIIGAHAKHVVSVERLPGPEPEWQPGDVIADGLGNPFLRQDDGRWRSFAGTVHADVALARPLTLLIHDRKVMTKEET